MITTIFFDFDGVLTTEESGSYTTCKNLQRVLSSISIEYILQCYRPHHRKLLLGYITHVEMWKDFCECLGENIEMHVLTQAFKDTPKNTEVFPIYQQLKTNYRLGIITDNSKDRFEVLKEDMNLSDTFEYFILSADLGSLKDNAINFKEALKLAGSQAEECIFIDNNVSNLIVPKTLGFQTIFHNHENA